VAEDAAQTATWVQSGANRPDTLHRCQRQWYRRRVLFVSSWAAEAARRIQILSLIDVGRFCWNTRTFLAKMADCLTICVQRVSRAANAKLIDRLSFDAHDRIW